MSNESESRYEMIITIVDKDMSSDVIEAAKAGGAEGATVLFGRGSGIHEKAKFFGLSIEPEKELILTLVESEICGQVVDSIGRGVDIDKPGNGVCFVLDVKRVIGISHKHQLLDKFKNQQNKL